ncbi:MAG: xanthine dehydrogenase small subunit, partial [Gammaproteobacteria bacterium]|nr:xanthine dehydrogenase small subunit [Gammaproteobacteria bacterium]
VLQYLREDLQKIGTKEGCAEGDCGACTVILADVADGGERVTTRAINSCIRFLPTIDGKELLTVESLQADDGELHPVQKAMVEHHGSQCGFCTPGFVMSMFALFKNNAAPTRREIDDALAGNLCRCTGYRPIVAAAEAMYAIANNDGDANNWLRAPAGDAEPADAAGRIELIRKARRDDSLAIEFAGRRFFAPRTLAELAGLLAAHPECYLLAGGTDVGLWVTKQLQSLDTVIYLGDVEELDSIAIDDGRLEIGAAVSLTDAMDALVRHYPQLSELLLRFASPPIRNSGTLVGNVANGSPIGDTMPALLALDAEVVLTSAEATRRMPLADFYLGYQQTALGRGEFVERVSIPLPAAGTLFNTYKVSKRFDQDISAVCGAFRVRVAGGIIEEARIAFGGMAAIPQRAGAAEAALCGNAWTEQSVRDAMPLLDRDFKPISDMRSSSEYRRQVCKNLLLRFWFESAGNDVRVYSHGR